MKNYFNSFMGNNSKALTRKSAYSKGDVINNGNDFIGELVPPGTPPQNIVYHVVFDVAECIRALGEVEMAGIDAGAKMRTINDMAALKGGDGSYDCK